VKKAVNAFTQSHLNTRIHFGLSAAANTATKR